ncbi:MAG: glycosyltransferase family 4 protein, partial [Chloroflexi bacterium]|nr:glycosyltransferase family 4 protein [Chloroflexota bacterium]
MSDIPYRLGLQQRVLAPYRAPFFDALAGACSKGLSVFAGTARPEETIGPPAALETAAFYPAHNLHLLSGRFYLCWQFGLLRWLHDWQPEVLVAEANPRYAHTPAALDWMQRRGRPVIGWGLGAPPTAAGWRDRSRRRFLARFDAMITYSQKGAEEYAQAGLHPGRIFVAPNAVAPRPQGEAPLHGAGEAGRPVVLFVGRLQPRKRVDLLLRACAALPAERRPQVWIV